jgi:hypothetical protein
MKLKSLSKSLVVFVAAVLLGLLVKPQAEAIPLELGLAIDGSGSIGLTDFNLQKAAYASVLSNLSVLPQDGSVAIGVWLFSNNVTLRFPTTVIDGTTIVLLINAINGMPFPNSTTALGPAIQAAATDLLGNSISSDRQVIDVSTDGIGNVGINQVTAANNAITAGIEQVNCIGVGGSANCNFIAGTGAFAVDVSDYSGFEAALRLKIIHEVTGGDPCLTNCGGGGGGGGDPVPTPAPEPMSIILLGSGLLGLGIARRRGAAKK